MWAIILVVRNWTICPQAADFGSAAMHSRPRSLLLQKPAAALVLQMRLSRAAVRTFSQLRMTARLLRPASSAAAVGRPAAAASLPRVHQTLGCCAAPVAIPLGFGSLRGSLAAARRLQYRVLSVVAQAEAGQPSQQPSAGAEAAEEQQEQAVETEELCIVNFYHLVDIKRPHEVRRSHCSQRQQPCPALLHAS